MTDDNSDGFDADEFSFAYAPRRAVALSVEPSRMAIPIKDGGEPSPPSQTPIPTEAVVDEAKDRETEEPWMSAYGIEFIEGRYHFRGYSFSTLGQAANYAERLRNPVPTVEPASDLSPSISLRAGGQTVDDAGLRRVEARDLHPADQARMVEFGITFVAGKFRSGGYGFGTLDQAVNYARRLRGGTQPLPFRYQASSVDGEVAAIVPRAPAWVGFGETANVRGIILSSGLVYVGTPVAGDVMAGDRNLIDPKLPIASVAGDAGGSALSYWPSYAGMSAAARRTYLEWLARGRTDPSVGIGYAFVFFYGLERRLFVDNALGEVDILVDEVRRLQAMYPEEHSFQHYARAFVAMAELVQETEIARPVVPPGPRYEFEIPLAVRRYLGVRLANHEPLDADDALLWLVSRIDTSLRTPGTRCFEELRALWRSRFASQHPDGLKVRAPKTRLSGVYRSASGAFDVTISLGDLPDIAVVEAPVTRLRDLLDSCINDLDSYSRLLGRRPDARGTLEAALCLPPDLRGTDFAAGGLEAQAALDALLGASRLAPVRVRDVCDIVGIAISDPKMNVALQRQIGTTLDRLDIAYEPDRRYGDGSLTPDGEMMIYKARHGAPTDPERAEYLAARTMVEVAGLAAVSDGEVVTAEMEVISEDLHSVPALTDDDRVRLMAYALWLFRDPPRQQAALTRLAKLPIAQRKRVTQAAISAVLADGHILPAEVRFLEKLYKALGLPESQVYATLHRGEVQFDAPVVVAPENWTVGVAIPPERKAEPARVAIDLDRLARVQRETSEVSSLLAEIFVDDDASPPIRAAPPPAGGASGFEGLEMNHSKLLLAMLAAGVMPRGAFEEQAKALRLLPDGALETINEWGFDTFDEVLLEGDDELMLPEHLRAPLSAMEYVQ